MRIDHAINYMSSSSYHMYPKANTHSFVKWEKSALASHTGNNSIKPGVKKPATIYNGTGWYSPMPSFTDWKVEMDPSSIRSNLNASSIQCSIEGIVLY
jgi:hypothetical protein